MAEKIDVEEKLRKELREEIEKTFKTQSELVFQQARFVVTLAKWALGFAALVLAILGIKAWQDIQNKVETSFKEKLDKKYRLGDPNSPIQNKLDLLLDRALVNALFTEVIREREELYKPSHQAFLEREVKVFNTGELDRLLRIVRLKETDEKVFNDAVFVLNSIIVSQEARQKVSAVLAELLSAKKGHEFEWMAINERKRISIINSFYHSEVIDSAATALLAQPVSDNLKYIVLQRIARENYRSAVPEVVRFIDSTEDQFYKIKGYRALGRIMPEHPRLKDFIEKQLLNSSNPKDAVLSMALAGDIAAAGKQDFFWQVSEERKALKRIIQDLALPLAARALDSGVILTFNSYGNSALTAELQDKSSSVRHTQNVNAKVYTQDLISPLLELAAEKSFEHFKRYFSSVSPKTSYVFSDDSKRFFTVDVSFRKDSEIRLSDGSYLRQNNVNGQLIRLEPRSNNGVIEVFALWKDLDGFIRGKSVEAIRNVDFKVQTTLDREPNSAIAFIS